MWRLHSEVSYSDEEAECEQCCEQRQQDAAAVGGDTSGRGEVGEAACDGSVLFAGTV